MSQRWGGRWSCWRRLCQLAVALAFLLREPERHAAPWPALAGALPSLAASGLVLAVGGPTPWSPVATTLLALGAAIATLGLFSLGRSFAVLPGVRTLRTAGLYRWVRHPLYTLAVLLGVANSLVAANWFFFVAGCLVFLLLAIRTRKEEENLVARFGDDYRNYMRRTGRFVPRL